MIPSDVTLSEKICNVRIYSGYVYDSSLAEKSFVGYYGLSVQQRAEMIEATAHFRSIGEVVNHKLILTVELLP